MNLYDLRITGGQDGVRYAAKLLSRFSYLANGVSGSDFKPDRSAPGSGQAAAASGCRRSSRSCARTVDKDVAAFNELLRRHSAGQVVTRLP